MDITERTTAEQTLRDLSGQLIRAREDECARIARELHDEINQRVALMSIELERLLQDPAKTDAELEERVGTMVTQTTELSTAIQDMSHDLHPSKLAHLGLAAAVKSLCAELSRGHGLRISFISGDVPPLSQEVSLCLYRVTQECLNNVIKHSGVKIAKVELHGFDQEVRLQVSDSGSGFDVEAAREKGRLGLISMRERLRLVEGTITITSQPSSGTQVKVSVPLNREGQMRLFDKQKKEFSQHAEDGELSWGMWAEDWLNRERRTAHLVKASAASELLYAIREVLRGRSYVTPMMTKEPGWHVLTRTTSIWVGHIRAALGGAGESTSAISKAANLILRLPNLDVGSLQVTCWFVSA